MRTVIFLLLILICHTGYCQSTNSLLDSVILNPKFNELMIQGRDTHHKLVLIDTFSLFDVGKKGKFDGLEIEVVNHHFDGPSMYKLIVSGCNRKKDELKFQIFNPANGMAFSFIYGIKNNKFVLNKTKFGFY